MTSRQMVLGSGAGPFASLWPAPWLAVAHNNDYPGGGSFDNYLHAFTSPDGLAWTPLAANTQGASILPSDSIRDGSLLHRAGRWWIVGTGDGASDHFAVCSSDLFGSGWSHLMAVSTAAASPTATWAPHWFVDPADDSVHVLVALQTSGTRKLYELHPTNGAMTTWSDPALVTGTGWATNSIDPDLTCWAGTYYLIWKNDDAGTLCLSTSSSPFSGYTVAQTGDWAGWKGGSGSIEGPKIVDIGTGWRIVFTHNSGYDAVAVYYSETTVRTMGSGWSGRTQLHDFDGYNHPLPIRR